VAQRNASPVERDFVLNTRVGGPSNPQPDLRGWEETLDGDCNDSIYGNLSGVLAIGLVTLAACSSGVASPPKTGGTVNAGATATGGPHRDRRRHSRPAEQSATGGVSAAGGESATGGVTAAGGESATGGVTTTGGASATGGVTAAGGESAPGGQVQPVGPVQAAA